MDISRVKSTGYFDRLVADGRFDSLFDSKGILIEQNEFIDCLMVDKDYHKHSLAYLRISLCGERDNNEDIKSILKIKEELSSMDLKEKICEGISKYEIAYADILILKGNYLYPINTDSLLRSEENLRMSASSTDDINNFISAHRLAHYIARKFRYDNPDDISIGIIDKVYVNKNFRNNKISNWIHSNLQSMILLYTGIYINGYILTYGDFSNEAEETFNMNNDTYKNMLRRHYKSNGYLDLSDIASNTACIDTSNIMYKIIG